MPYSTGFLLFLTISFYYIAERLYQKAHHQPLLHPLATATIPLGLTLLWLDVDIERYQAANHILLFLLAPAVVLLAVPMYAQRHTLQKHWLPILSIIILGAITTVIIALAFVYILNGSEQAWNSMLTKSITTPIALEMLDITQGNAALAVGIIIFTGIVGAVVAPWIFNCFGIKDERLMGLLLGITAHGVGTARAFEISIKAGAYASLGLCLCGLITAIGLPILLFI